MFNSELFFKNLEKGIASQSEEVVCKLISSVEGRFTKASLMKFISFSSEKLLAGDSLLTLASRQESDSMLVAMLSFLPMDGMFSGEENRLFSWLSHENKNGETIIDILEKKHLASYEKKDQKKQEFFYVNLLWKALDATLSAMESTRRECFKKGFATFKDPRFMLLSKIATRWFLLAARYLDNGCYLAMVVNKDNDLISLQKMIVSSRTKDQPLSLEEKIRFSCSVIEDLLQANAHGDPNCYMPVLYDFYLSEIVYIVLDATDKKHTPIFLPAVLQSFDLIKAARSFLKQLKNKLDPNVYRKLKNKTDQMFVDVLLELGYTEKMVNFRSETAYLDYVIQRCTYVISEAAEKTSMELQLSAQALNGFRFRVVWAYLLKFCVENRMEIKRDYFNIVQDNIGELQKIIKGKIDFTCSFLAIRRKIFSDVFLADFLKNFDSIFQFLSLQKDVDKLENALQGIELFINFLSSLSDASWEDYRLNYPAGSSSAKQELERFKEKILRLNEALLSKKREVQKIKKKLNEEKLRVGREKGEDKQSRKEDILHSNVEHKKNKNGKAKKQKKRTQATNQGGFVTNQMFDMKEVLLVAGSNREEGLGVADNSCRVSSFVVEEKVACNVEEVRAFDYNPKRVAFCALQRQEEKRRKKEGRKAHDVIEEKEEGKKGDDNDGVCCNKDRDGDAVFMKPGQPKEDNRPRLYPVFYSPLICKVKKPAFFAFIAPAVNRKHREIAESFEALLRNDCHVVSTRGKEGVVFAADQGEKHDPHVIKLKKLGRCGDFRLWGKLVKENELEYNELEYKENTSVYVFDELRSHRGKD